MRRQRSLTTILVLPITLGTVFVAEGLLTFLGPRGWFNQTLLIIGIIDNPIKLIATTTGVACIAAYHRFSFAFPLTLSYITGIDPRSNRQPPRLERPRQRFLRVFLPPLVPGLAVTFCLAFVQAFAVFPSLQLSARAGGLTPRHLDTAYQAAFEQYDHSLCLGDRAHHGRRRIGCSAGCPRRTLILLPPRRRHERLTMIRDQGLTSRIWRFAIWALATLFVPQSPGGHRRRRRQFLRDTMARHLAAGRLTTKWYFSAWKEFQLSSVVLVTFETSSPSSSSPAFSA